MKKIFSAFLLLSFCSKKQTSKQPIITINSSVPSQIHTSIKNAVVNYYAHYGYPDSVSISASNNSICRQKKVEGGAIMSPLAYSTSKKIFFCDSAVKYFTPEITYSITTHELFHTLVNDTTLVKPFSILDGKYKVLGYCGLAVLVQKVGGVKTSLRSIEEASAEVCARGVVPNYKATSKSYLEVGNKLASIGKYKFTLMDLINFQRSNDFPAFCAKLLQKSKGSITKDDVEKTILVFGL